MSDAELMRRMNAGSIDALGVLYERYFAHALRLARAICKSPESAEEAVHDAFEAIWRSRRAYRSERGAVGAWTMSIVRYRALDISRGRGLPVIDRGGGRSDEAASPRDQLVDEVVRNQESEHLRRVLARVPPNQREVITLAFYGQLSHSEVADRLGLPPGTVKGRMRLGLDKLRKELERPQSLPPLRFDAERRSAPPSPVR